MLNILANITCPMFIWNESTRKGCISRRSWRLMINKVCVLNHILGKEHCGADGGEMVESGGPEVRH